MARVAEVAFQVPLHKTFDYLLPEELQGRAEAGSRVRAPFGPRRLSGIVVSVREGEAGGRTLKTLEGAEPALWGGEMVELARWLSSRYCAPIGECLSALLPAYIRPLQRAARTVSAPEPGPPAGPRYELNEAQVRSLERLSALLDAGRHSRALVLGVPASGKTELYMRLLAKVAERGGQALFLVPEIALTRPFLEEFRARLPVPVVAWHSKAPAAAKRQGWFELASGRPAVVVGARSASLLPLPKLGLVVVDEEQDPSYKQDTAPCYHARELALERARRAGVLAVLGSATPSLESYREAAEGRSELLKLPRGALQSRPPEVKVLDRRLNPYHLLLPELSEELKKARDAKDQAILVVNRRGFSSLTLCRQCGWLCQCPRCGIAMVLHHEPRGRVLRCHHCEGLRAPPAACPKGHPVFHQGAGTQRAEEETRTLLPDARVLRFDRDTVAADKEGASLYDRFKKLEADVMVGTQLVSKGYHFPEVTLVGIVDADAMLHFPDFRGSEKTFQLLVQAAGRAGRAQKPGRVLLQTFHPEHYAIQAAAAGDYEAFAAKELESRRELGYPPFGRLARVVLSSAEEDKAQRAAEEALAALASVRSNATELLGPAPAFYRKLRSRYRYHLLVKTRLPAAWPGVLEALRALRPAAGASLKVVVDPHDLF